MALGEPNSSYPERAGVYQEHRARLFMVVYGGRVRNNRHKLKQYVRKRSSIDLMKKCLHRTNWCSAWVIWSMKLSWDLSCFSVRQNTVNPTAAECQTSEKIGVFLILELLSYLLSSWKNQYYNFAIVFGPCFQLSWKVRRNNTTMCFQEKTTLKINCMSYLSGPFAIMGICYWKCNILSESLLIREVLKDPITLFVSKVNQSFKQPDGVVIFRMFYLSYLSLCAYYLYSNSLEEEVV